MTADFVTRGRRLRFGLLAFPLLALGVALWRWTPTARATAPDIVLVVIDCLRRDHVTAYGYGRDTTPFLDRWAETGLTFTRAYSTAAWTKPAIASILTGRYPHRHRVVDVTDRFSMSQPVLSERLIDQGYATMFLNGGNTFVSDEFGFERGFDIYMYARLRHVGELHAQMGEAIDRAGEDRPLFAYVHIMDAHLPYRRSTYNERYTTHLEDAPGRLKPDLLGPRRIRMMTQTDDLSQPERQRLVDLYDGQVRLVDDHLAELAALFERTDRGRPLVWIVTADHGEEFWEHGNYEHGHTLYDEVVAVPLVVYGAGIPAMRVDAPVSLVDVPATILDLAGAPPDLTADGQSLLRYADRSPGRERTDRTLLLMGTVYGTEKVGVIAGDMKAIRSIGPAGAKLELVGAAATEPIEVYDRSRDPGERANLAAEDPALASDWRGRLDEISALSQHVEQEPDQQVIDEKTRRRLRALGYLQ